MVTRTSWSMTEEGRPRESRNCTIVEIHDLTRKRCGGLLGISSDLVKIERWRQLLKCIMERRSQILMLVNRE
jgi:hypothetical protein